MLKPILRILALFALAMALITAVLDITRSIADSSLIMTSLGVDWFNVSPSTLQAAQPAVQNYLHPILWDPIIQTILLSPSWFVFGVLWLILSLLGRNRRSRWQNRYEN
ncbi:MAG: hypothetical protein WBC71_02615 [Salaquimonas sp.]